ncbi:MAG TPA: hypothetical protein VFV50_15130 [Bdellovibrionales bacterium]|nr:hypothetical protein [Bdellovibrionales bacterium]
MALKRLFTIILPLLIAAGCNQNQTGENPPPQVPETQERDRARAGQMLVVGADGKPLAGAKVLIGLALNQPFSGNFLTADSNGLITVPVAWTSPQPVTIQAPGHTRVTFLGQLPQGQQFQVPAHVDEYAREVRGVATGIEPFIKDKDGYLDFAVVTPLVTLEDILMFETGQLISPENDTISILGQSIKIPSNLSLPRQRESIGIITITPEKPTYRLRVSANRDVPLAALRGRAKQSALTDAAGPELVNSVESFGGGIRPLAAGTGTATLNIPAAELTFPKKVDVVAPQFSSADMMTSMAFARHDANYLYPTDIKVHAPGQTWKLSVSQNAQSHLTFTWTKKDFKQNRAASLMLARPGGERVAANFLQLVPKPQLTGTTLTLSPPAGTRGVQAAATYIAYSDVQITSNQTVDAEKISKKWEFFAPGWVTSVSIPVWPEGELATQNTRRWEVLFLGREGAGQSTQSINVNAHDFSNVTHVTRNLIDL